MECFIHHDREATHKCATCGEPICDTCYEASKSHQYCPTCIREVIREEKKEAECVLEQNEKDVKKIKKGMLIGLIIGLVLGIGSLITAYVALGSIGGLWLEFVIEIVLLPFIVGSLGTLTKKAGKIVEKQIETTNWNDDLGVSQGIGVLMIVLKIGFCIIFAPIVTLVRLGRAKKNIALAKKAYDADVDALAAIDNYLVDAGRTDLID